MPEPITRTVEVPCDQATAFTVFIEEMASWWPLERFSVSALGGGRAKGLRIESRSGGEIVELGSEGDEHRWGTIRAYEPPAFLSMDFHVPHPSETDPGTTLVEVRFTRLDDDRTRVELVQSRWEGLGPMADMASQGYGSAWGIIFGDRYAAACAAAG